MSRIYELAHTDVDAYEDLINQSVENPDVLTKFEWLVYLNALAPMQECVPQELIEDFQVNDWTYIQEAVLTGEAESLEDALLEISGKKKPAGVKHTQNKESLESQTSLFFYKKAGDSQRIKREMNAFQDQITNDTAPTIKAFIIDDTREMLAAVQFAPNPMDRWVDMLPQQHERYIEFFAGLYAPVAQELGHLMVAEFEQKGFGAFSRLETKQPLDYWFDFLQREYRQAGALNVVNINLTTMNTIRNALLRPIDPQPPQRPVTAQIPPTEGQQDIHRIVQTLISRTGGLPQIIMGQQREHVIARTETAYAMNSASLETAKQSSFGQANALIKEWSSTLDSRTRSPRSIYRDRFDHVSAHGQQKPLDEPFIVSGEQLMHPGDRAYGGASAGNVIGCRCVMIFVPGDATAEATQFRQQAFDVRDRFLNEVYEQEGIHDQRAIEYDQVRANIENYQTELQGIYRDFQYDDALYDPGSDLHRRVQELNSLIETENEELRRLRGLGLEFTEQWQLLVQPEGESAAGMLDPVYSENYGMQGPLRNTRFDAARGTEDFSELLSRDLIDQIEEQAGKIVDPEFKESVQQFGKRWSAYYSPGDKAIYLKPGSTARTVMHELGHWLEDQIAEVHEMALEFLNERTYGEEPQKLSDLTGNDAYDPWELARPDEFHSPYVGKDYGGYATEIISMGLEQYYINPLEFAEQDPEFFDLITRVLNGWY